MPTDTTEVDSSPISFRRVAIETTIKDRAPYRFPKEVAVARVTFPDDFSAAFGPERVEEFQDQKALVVSPEMALHLSTVRSSQKLFPKPEFTFSRVESRKNIYYSKVIPGGSRAIIPIKSNLRFPHNLRHGDAHETDFVHSHPKQEDPLYDLGHLYSPEDLRLAVSNPSTRFWIVPGSEFFESLCLINPGDRPQEELLQIIDEYEAHLNSFTEPITRGKGLNIMRTFVRELGFRIYEPLSGQTFTRLV